MDCLVCKVWIPFPLRRKGGDQLGTFICKKVKCKGKLVYLHILLNGVAGIQKEMKQIIVSTYANELLLVGIFFCNFLKLFIC